MKWSLRRSEKAIDDLAEILDYIGLDNPSAAERLVVSILEAFERTSDFPEIGRAVDEIGAGFRMLSKGNYVLIYRVVSDENVIELVRVIHTARDWPSLFNN